MIQAAVRNRISTLVLALGLALFGAFNLPRIPVDFLPDITYPLVKLSIEWKGATPEDIDRNLADPIEREMASVEGLDFLSSSSLEGLYQLDVNFRYGVNPDVAYQDALAAFARAQKNLPPDIEPAVIIKADPSQLPVVEVVFESDRMDLRDLRLWIDNWLVERLLAAHGVAAADVAGGLEREIRILIRPESLEKYGLSLDAIERRLLEENVQRLGGRVTGPHQETIVRTLGEYRHLDEIRGITLLRKGADRIRLGDIARVEDSHEEVRLLTRYRGRPAVKVNIIKQADANTILTVRSVEETLRSLQPSFPAGVAFHLVQNQADYIIGAIKGVRSTAIEAALLVILGFFLFLGNPRIVFIIVVALPITVLANFFVMRMAGFSLNILSLGGLIVAISVLLDPSTIVLENIARRMRKDPHLPPGDVAIEFTREVAPAVVAAGLAFVALFVPFLLVQGMVPLLFRELVLVILSVVVLSSLGALTLTPTLAAWLLRPGANQKSATREPFDQRLNRAMQALYRPAVGFCLRHRLLVIFFFAVILASGVLAFVRSGAEFFPAVDDGRIIVKVRMPAGVPLAEMDEVIRRIEALVQDDPRVRNVFALTGGAVRGLYTNKIGNEAQVDIELVPRSQRKLTTSQFLAELRPKVTQISAPGARIMPALAKMRGIRTLGQSDIEVEIKGPDLATLFDQARSVAAALEKRPGLTNVYVSLDFTKPEFQVTVDRERAADAGLSVSAVAAALRGYIGGDVPTRYREGNELYDVRVLVPERDIRSRSDVENFSLALPGGGFARLGTLAKVEPSTGPVEILRQNQVKQVIVRVDAQKISLGNANREVADVLAGLDWPAGYSYTIGGKAKQMGEMQGTVREILALALFFSFIILAVQFNSLRLPFVVLVAAPFCLAGVGYGLYLTGQPFGVTVIVGVLVVLAANANDAVLLVETAERLRAEGMEKISATLEAAVVRLRPRLMTTLPVVLGFMPLAFAWEEGGELMRPMACAAIGGLLAEVAVAIFLVPVFYSLFSGQRLREPAHETTHLPLPKTTN